MLVATLYCAYQKTSPDCEKSKRDFSKRAKALDRRINKLTALKDGKVNPTKVHDMKVQLRVRSAADVRRELDRLKDVRAKARTESKDFTNRYNAQKLNAEAERFSRFKAAKQGANLKIENIPNPDDHFQSWNDRWGIPTNLDSDSRRELDKVISRCDFVQGSARKINSSITEEEVHKALIDTHPWKAPGPDGVYTSLVRRFKEQTVPILCRLYNKIWEGESIPGEWFTTGRTLLFKKNEKSAKDPVNYRPITMLNTTYKLFSAIINRRMILSMLKHGNWDRDQQALNRTRRGCLDAHLISEVTVRLCKKTIGKTLSVAYIDFQKAYDSVSHESLLAVLEKTLAGDVDHQKQRLLNIVKMLMNRWKTVMINLEGDHGKEISIERGIFQGDKMSPTLFCISLTLLKALRYSRIPVRSDGKDYTTDKVCYMDEIKVFVDSIYHLYRKVGEIKRLARLIGLSFNDSKSGVVTEVEAEALQKTKTLKTFPIVGRGSAKTYKYLRFEQYWVNGSTTKETVLAEAY